MQKDIRHWHRRVRWQVWQIQNFRNELNIIRDEYDKQRALDRQKYNLLVEQYRSFEEESIRKEKEYKDRIQQLEELVNKYEKRIETPNEAED